MAVTSAAIVLQSASSHVHVLIDQQVPQAQQVGHEVLLPIADVVLPSRSGGPRVAGPIAVELLLAADELIATGDATHRLRGRTGGRNFYRGRRFGRGRQLVRGAVHCRGSSERQLVLMGGRDGADGLF